MTTSVQVRSQLIDALRLDLVGPRPAERGHDTYEYAVGHNVSAVAVPDATGRCREVRTAWMPAADVEKVIPTKIKNVQLGMEGLAEAVRTMVGPMVSEYAGWIGRQAAKVPADDAARARVARDLLTNARQAGDRIRAGLDALDDPLALEAFRIRPVGEAAGREDQGPPAAGGFRRPRQAHGPGA